MVSGFKDEKGRFHPIQKYKRSSRRPRVRYSNDSASTEKLNQEVKNFSTKIRDRYNQYKANQLEEFNREIALRRKFQGRLITAYRQARAQQIKDPRKMEKFIRQQIPDLPHDKSINKFVVSVIKDFQQSEKELEKQKKGKSEDEKKALQDDFDNSLKESEAIFKNIQGDQDEKFAKETKKQEEAFKKKIEKLEKQAKEQEEKARQAEKDAEEARRTAQSDASQEEKKEATMDAQESREEAKEEAQQTQDFAQDVFEELKKEEQKINSADFNFGFPQEII